MSKIKPCPFCGVIPEVSIYTSPKSNDGRLFQVSCWNENCTCEVHSGEKVTKKLAIDAWNTRSCDR